MKQKLTIQNIDLQQIDFSDFSYWLSPEREVAVPAALKESIAGLDILHPPIVRENSPGSYVIVGGRKRLHAKQQLDPAAACACLVIPRRTEAVAVFHLLLAENQLSRRLTAAERAIFLQKAAEVMDEGLVIKEFLPLLGLAPDHAVLKKTLALLTLETPILLGMHQGDISETVALDLVSLTAADRATLFEIISSLQLSCSNQKKLLTICRELAARENTGLTAVLDKEAVHEILQHPGANPPQKCKNLMAWLCRRHMPRARQAEEEFNRFIGAMRLPRDVAVAHTPFFEDDAVTLSITFQNRKSLQDAWEKIRHAIDDNDN